MRRKRYFDDEDDVQTAWKNKRCPGGKIRSRGRGRGLGIGRGRGPIGRMR